MQCYSMWKLGLPLASVQWPATQFWWEISILRLTDPLESLKSHQTAHEREGPLPLAWKWFEGSVGRRRTPTKNGILPFGYSTNFATFSSLPWEI